MVCRATDISDLTHDIRRVRFEVVSGGPFVFSAGQYARVTFTAQPTRDYSMANIPADECLEFHIRHVPGGTSSSFVRTHLLVGDEARVEGPFGSSWLRENSDGPIIALAGGSGLAPIKSIVEQALTSGMTQNIALYFGVRDECDIYHQVGLAALAERYPNFTFVTVLSEPTGPTRRRTGFLHEALRQDLEAGAVELPADGRAYLAGPPPMVEAATSFLETAGMSRASIHADAFYTEAEKSEREFD